MTPTLPRALAAVLLLSPLAVAQGQLDATYSFAAIGAELTGFCAAGSPVELYSEYGSITFLPNGTFSSASVLTSNCTPGSYPVSPDAENGTYSLSYEGDLTLDFTPSNPGVNLAELFLTLDRHVIVERQNSSAGLPSLTFAIRRSSGMTDADLSGAYAVSAFLQDVTAAGRQMAGVFGSVQFDGVGGFTNAITQLVIDPTGVISTLASTGSGTYTVLANGQLLKDGFSTPVGQLSPDGRFGFTMDTPGSPGELTLFVAKKGAPPTADAVEGDWSLVGYGATIGSAASGGEIEAHTGEFTFNPTLGNYTLTATTNLVSNTGGSGGTGTGTGAFTLLPDGSFTTLETGETFSNPGWLSAGENVRISATIDPTSGGPAIAFLVRKWGSLTPDNDAISVTSGGAQTLEIRAGDEFAGQPYLVLGTTTGSYPGLTLGGANIPLNYSGHLLFTLNNLNVAPFSGTFGLLGGDGKSTAAITIPPMLFSSTAGANLLSALIVFDPSGFSNVVHVSQPVPLSLIL